MCVFAFLGGSPRASLMQEPPLCVSSVICLDTSHSCVGALKVKLHVFPMKTGLWCSQLCLGSAVQCIASAADDRGVG